MSPSRTTSEEPIATTAPDGMPAAPRQFPPNSSSTSRTKRSPSPPDVSNRSISRSSSPSRSRSPSPMGRRDNGSRSPSTSRFGARNGSEAVGPCVKVTGLTKAVTKAHLEDVFAYYGSIKACQSAVFARSQERKGHAWILYCTSAGAEMAIEHMDKGQIDGAVVSVEFGKFPSRSEAVPRDQLRNGRYPPLDARDDEWDRRPSRNRASERIDRDRYESSSGRYANRGLSDGPLARYPPPRYSSRHFGNGYPRSSLSPPPRQLKRQRSLSPSISPPRDGDRRRYSYAHRSGRGAGSMSRSPSRSSSSSRSRSRSYTPRRHQRLASDSRSRSRSSRSPSFGPNGRGKVGRHSPRIHSRSPSPPLPPATRRGGSIGRDLPLRSTSRSESRGRARSPSRSQSGDRT